MGQAVENQGLRRNLDLWAVIALGLGSAMGVSIFSALGEATRLAGTGLLVAVVVAAVPMGFIAVAYAFMGTVLPTSGASYEWPRRYISPAVAFAVSWLRIAANTGALVILALVMTRYLSMLVQVPEKLTMFLSFVVLGVANLAGIGIASNVQKYMMGGLLCLFAVFCLFGLGGGDWQPERVTPLLGYGWTGVLAALPLLINLFFGIESATELGDEIADSRKTVARGIVLSIVSAVAVYLLVAVTCLGLLGAPALGLSTAPIVDAAVVALGPYGKPLVVAAALMAILKSMNGIFMVFSRSLYAMGRTGALPAVFARVHPRWNTPHIACLTVFALATAGLLLPTELTFLFLAIGIPTLVKYFCICLCARIALRADPGLADGFGLSRSGVLWCSGIGACMAVGLVAVGFETDWRPYAALGIWGALGAALYLFRRSGRQPGVTTASR